MDFNWSLLLIPIIAALVGWGTNYLALKMTFYPLEFRGWFVFGWQGVIPAKAPKLAKNVMELITGRLMDVEELFAQLDPKLIAKEMEPVMERLARDSVDKAMKKQIPFAWKIITNRKKEEIYENALSKLPDLVEDIFRHLKENAKEIFNIEALIEEELLKDKALLNRVFLKCGEKEFRFIERSGIYFGFLFGCIQMLIWNSFAYWWILPLGGLIVGFVTNWLALQLIFRPLKPYKIGSFTLQGLFIKRQAEVSEVYAKIFTEEILSTESIFDHMLRNNGAERLIDLTQEHLKEGFDGMTSNSDRIMFKLLTGSEKYFKIRDLIISDIVEVLPNSVRVLFGGNALRIDIKSSLEQNMKALSAEEFEGALHPIFQEEEWILIFIGAALGTLAGALQLLFLI